MINVTCDVMHDLIERICRYVDENMAQILNYLMKIKRYFINNFEQSNKIL